jgi:UrcA family protein
MKRVVASITVCAALALASQAGAQEPVTRSMSVPVASVDFNKPAQVEALYAQLKAGARKMCRGSTRTLADRDGESACREAALDNAVKQAAGTPLASRHSQMLASAR